MTSPRFTVGTVTGWPISANVGRQRKDSSTIAYVYDRLNCYRPVARFDRGRFPGGLSGVTPEMAAQRLADELNNAKPIEPPKPKPKAKPKPKPVKVNGCFTEYLGYVVYVAPVHIFIYDLDGNLLATVTTMGGARLTIQRLRRQARG